MGDRIELPASSTPDVAVVVLATRDAVRLERCLRAIADSDLGGRASQVVLCVNAADPDVVALVEATKGAVVMRSQVNLGTAATWNRAIEHLDAPRVATVHEDAFVDPNALALLADALDADPIAAIAGGHLSYPDGRVQTRGWIHWRAGTPWPISPQLAPGLELPARVTPVDAVSSAMMLVDGKFLSARGGFDEGTFPAVTTEFDLCASAWAAGRTVVVVDDARAVHETGAMVARHGGWRASTPFREFLIARNCARYDERWASLLAGRPPAPASAPDTEAMRASLARVVAAAREPVRSPHPSPPVERLVTGDASPELDAPPEVEARATALMRERLEEFADWMVIERDRLLEHEADISEWHRQTMEAITDERARHAELVDEFRNVMEVLTDDRALHAELLDELAARDRTLTWRLRARALRIPGVARARARRRTG
ncbi:MAG: glycosyltransferase [Acidimicrobiia bacterium]